MGRQGFFRYKYWTIAYRTRGTTPVYREEKATDFKVVLRAKSGIQADPFLIRKDGKSYLFYETAGPVTGKGKIACLCLEEADAKPRIVLKEPFHLSYPFVFCHAGEYYMMPEGRQGHRVMLYRAKRFPWEWEPCRELLAEDAVDSTLFARGGKQYLFTYRDGALEVYACETDGKGLPQKTVLLHRSPKSKRMRPAGNVIRDGDRYLRPAQLCENFYGEAVLINEIDMEREDFWERERFRLQASRIQIPGLEILGIHTYNADERYEVVDLYCVQDSPWALVKKCCYIPLQMIYERWQKKRSRT